MSTYFRFSFFLTLVILYGIFHPVPTQSQDSLLLENSIIFESYTSTDSNESSTTVYPPQHYEEGHELDYALWENLTKELEYNDTLAIKRNKKNFNFSPKLNLNTTFLQYVLYLLAIGAIIFIVYKLIGNINTFDSKVTKSNTSFEQIEDDEVLMKKELDSLLEKALTNEDYRSAIRIRFIQSLQVLENKKYIHWKKEKTNRNYLSELISKEETYITFSTMVLWYEKAWYGSCPIEKADYDSFHLLYQQLLAH